jgi:hypothetical protein
MENWIRGTQCSKTPLYKGMIIDALNERNGLELDSSSHPWISCEYEVTIVDGLASCEEADMQPAAFLHCFRDLRRCRRVDVSRDATQKCPTDRQAEEV